MAQSYAACEGADQRIDLWFERRASALALSEIVVGDGDLSPPAVLLESAEVA